MAIRKFFDGFKYAFDGFYKACGSERNLKFHLFATCCVITAGFLLKISVNEWIATILCCGVVIGAELFNTAIEKLCDTVEPNKNPKIGFVKDVAAGGVLICAAAAACVGLIIFVPKLIALF